MNERRLLLALAVVCLLVAVGAVGYGAGKASDMPEVIRAQRFEVVDEEGKVLAVLGVENGDTSLVLYGEEGERRVVLSVLLGAVPDLMLYDAKGAGRAGLSVLDGRGPRLALYDERRWSLAEIMEGEGPLPRAALSVGPGGAPSLTLADEQGKVLWRAP